MEQTEAILIRKQPWSDTSLITTWITAKYGKLRTLARSVHRTGNSLAGRLDLFYKAEIAFAANRKSTLHTLREVKLIEPFDASLVPYKNIFLCGYFAEVVDLSTEPGQPAPEIYDLLARAVGHLRLQAATNKALEYFECELCRLLGVQDDKSQSLQSISTYCGRIPASRAAAVRLISN